MIKSNKTKCYITIEDEVTAVIGGLHSSDAEKLHDTYSIFAPNYFFHPKYKLGSWDGKIRYFHKTGKTFVYLLAEIIPKLIKWGYKPVIEDYRKGPYVNAELTTADHFAHCPDPKDPTKPFTARYYQVDAVNELIACGGGLVVAATSAGKTTICGLLVDAYGQCLLKTLTIVPDTTLVMQTVAMYEHLQLDVGEFTGKNKDLEHEHIVGTWQTIKNYPHIMGMFQVVIVDEVHKAKSKVLNELINIHGKNIPYRFGMTGTLPKDPADALTIQIAFGDIKYEIPAEGLIEEGYLSALDIQILQLVENHPEGYFPDYASERSYLVTRSERLAWIADKMLTASQQEFGNVMCLVSSVAIGKKLAKLIPNAIFLYGKDDAADRKKVYDLFENNNNLIVIATVHIAGTGLSIDRIFNLFLIDIGKSFTRVIQAIGRGLRKGVDKWYVNVFDICSTLKYSNMHKNERVKYYKEAKYPYTRKKIMYRNYANDKFSMSQEQILQQLEDEISLDY